MSILNFEEQMFEHLYDLDDDHRKKYGITFTPVKTVQFMFDSVGISGLDAENTSFLEPSCGLGVYVLYYLNYLIDNNKINQNNVFLILNNIFATDLHQEFVDLTKKSIQTLLVDNNLIPGESDEASAILDNNIYKSDFLFDSSPKNEFDLIIGNPPYVRHHYIEKDYKQKLSKEYSLISTGMADLSLYFVYKSHSLLSDKGIMSFITSNKFKTTKYGSKFRREMFPFLSSISYEDDVFDDVQIDTQVFNYNKNKTTSFLLNKLKVIKAEGFDGNEWSDFSHNNISGLALKELGITITNGLVSGFNKSHILNEEQYISLKNRLISENESQYLPLIQKIVNGKDINLKLGTFSHSKYIIFATNKNCDLIKESSVLFSHLSQFTEKLENRSWFKSKKNIDFFQLQSESQVYSPNNTYFATKRIGGLKFVEIDSDVRYMDTVYQLIVPDEFDIKKVIEELDSDSVKDQFIKISNKIGSGYEVHKNKFERLILTDSQIINIKADFYN